MDPDAEGAVLSLLTGLRVPGRAGPVALGTAGDRVVWTGPAAQAAGHGPATDLTGLLLTSAFVDAHVHVTDSGLLRTGLDLTGCRSAAGLLAAVAASDVTWGHGWDETRWPDGVPDRAELDRAAAGRAVYLTRVDAHSALATTALLDRAGVPRDVRGPLTGEAHHRVRRAALDALGPQRRAAQLAFLADAARRGIAEVHECAGPEISGRADLAELLALDTGVAVAGFWGEAVTSADDARGLLAATGAAGLAGDLFVDGSLGSRTAALHDPYADAPGCTGLRHLDDAALLAHLVACTEAGITAGFHVIGDAAVAAAVDALEETARLLSPAAVRAAGHRLEHLEMVDAGQARRLAALGVAASVQPAFDATWGGPDGMYATRLGPGRALGLNPFATLHAAGVTLLLGSDSPVTPPDPWATIRAATGHLTPGAALDERTALAAHTGGRPVPVTGGPATYALWDGERCVRTVRAGRVLHDDL